MLYYVESQKPTTIMMVSAIWHLWDVPTLNPKHKTYLTLTLTLTFYISTSMG